MTGKADFTSEEWELIRGGPPAAGTLTALASSGGTFRESWEMAKAFGEARRQHGDSELVNAIVDENPHVQRYHSREDAEQKTVEQLSAAVSVLEQKATPEEADAYRQFTLAVARRVAEAHSEHGSTVSDEEQTALDKISAALGSPAAS